MKISIIGGGPAGMYFAILMKKADPKRAITIYERNGPDDTFGWGVVFSGKTLRNLRDADEPTHAEITRDFVAWNNVDVLHGNEKISIHGNSFSGIARIRLLKILQRRCEELGIHIHFRTEVTDIDSLKSDSDLLVAADGVNSTVRQKFAQHFQPDLSTRPNKYIWYGTNQLFHGLTLTFRETPAGVFAAHSYKFDQTTSTFIVECDPQTWDESGFATMSDAETRSFLGEVFAKDLGGRPLLSNNSKWINFVLVKNARWFFENVVLLGDALHTAHFSIGSGTKLAIEDAIALNQCIVDPHEVSAVLARFEQVRKPVIEDYQASAYESMVWFENARQYMHLSPMELAYSLMKRSGRVDDAELRKRDPQFVERYEQRATRCFRAGTEVKTQHDWKSIEQVQPGELVWTHRNRLKQVIGVQPHPHVGRIIGIRVQGRTQTIWMTPSQKLYSPSPHAERGLGGEDAARVNPAPNPSPRAGRGEVQHKLGGSRVGLWKLGRELKKNSTAAEKTLWNELRGKKLGVKFRRQHSLGNYIADFYAPDALLAIELDGSIHDSARQRWADGIRHRQIGQAGVRILRFRNDRVLRDLGAVLSEIRECLSPSPHAERGLGGEDAPHVDPTPNPSPQGGRGETATGLYSLNAGGLRVGDQLIFDATGLIAVVESVESAFTNEAVYDLIVEEDHSFITRAGIACE